MKIFFQGKFSLAAGLLLAGWMWGAVFCCAGETDPAQWNASDFLYRVRNVPSRHSWALMKGSARHVRKGNRPVRCSLEMGIFFTPVQTLAQIRFGGENEVYTVGQSYGKTGATHVKSYCKKGYPQRIGVYGITPEELAMSFLYWDLKKELPSDSVRGQTCRVFLLENKERTLLAKVSISKDYFFPVRAEFSASSKPEKIFKTLEAAAFKRENGYYFVSRINLRGDQWSTQIRFDDLKAGAFEKKLPAGVFIKIPDGK